MQLRKPGPIVINKFAHSFIQCPAGIQLLSAWLKVLDF